MVGQRRSQNRDPHPMFRDAISVTRFWSLVDKRGEHDCWPWLGDFDKDGYGIFVFGGRRYGAHELSLSFTTGEKRISQLDTCHSCNTPFCVNPKHLRFDTRKSNVADMIQSGRARYAKTFPDEVIRIIRERRNNGARQIDLAEDFGVSSAYISQLVRGIKRPDAPGPIEGAQAQYVKGAE